MTGTYVAAMCYFYSSPGRGDRTLWRACLFVCMCVFVFLSVHRHIPRTTCPIFTQFLCMLPMAMARSPGSVAVVYLLSVYWMISYTSTSLLHGSWTPRSKPRYTEDCVILKWTVVPTHNKCGMPVRSQQQWSHRTVAEAVCQSLHSRGS